MARLVRKTTAQIVADEIRHRILSGQLKEGEQIRQEAIASDLGVSRIPVREALRQLEAEGLVTLVSHKGAEVTRLEPSEIAELFELRLMMESWLFEQAIGAIDESQLQAAEKLVEEMRNDAEIADWGTLNWKFHEVLYNAANRKATMRILKRIHDNIDRYVRLQITVTKDGQEKAHKEHLAIVSAAREGNANLAVALLTDHINHVRDQLLASLSRDA